LSDYAANYAFTIHNMNHDQDNLDSRIVKTRRALFEVFMELVLKQRYDDIQTSEIISKAGIARSTFYEHFSGKDDLLVKSMHGLLAVLAEAATQPHQEERLRWVLEHFWENRSMARIILQGRPYQLIKRQLAKLIAQQWLKSSEQSNFKSMELPAIGLAESQWAMIKAWLTGEVNTTLQELLPLLAYPGNRQE